MTPQEVQDVGNFRGGDFIFFNMFNYGFFNHKEFFKL